MRNVKQPSIGIVCAWYSNMAVHDAGKGVSRAWNQVDGGVASGIVELVSMHDAGYLENGSMWKEGSRRVCAPVQMLWGSTRASAAGGRPNRLSLLFEQEEVSGEISRQSSKSGKHTVLAALTAMVIYPCVGIIPEAMMRSTNSMG